jgi:hypothetical protein
MDVGLCKREGHGREVEWIDRKVNIIGSCCAHVAVQ